MGFTTPVFSSEQHTNDSKTLSTTVAAGLVGSALFVTVQNYSSTTEPTVVRHEAGGDRAITKVVWQSGTYHAVWIGVLLAPSAETCNIEVTGSTPKFLTAQTFSYVNQSTPTGTPVSQYETSKTNAGDKVSATTNDIVLSVCGFGANHAFSSYNGTLRSSYAWQTNNGIFGVSTHAGAASVDCNYQVATSSSTAHAAVPIKAYESQSGQVIMF
jgi:hypothetical protein